MSYVIWNRFAPQCGDTWTSGLAYPTNYCIVNTECDYSGTTKQTQCVNNGSSIYTCNNNQPIQSYYNTATCTGPSILTKLATQCTGNDDDYNSGTSYSCSNAIPPNTYMQQFYRDYDCSQIPFNIYLYPLDTCIQGGSCKYSCNGSESLLQFYNSSSTQGCQTNVGTVSSSLNKCSKINQSGCGFGCNSYYWYNSSSIQCVLPPTSTVSASQPSSKKDSLIYIGVVVGFLTLALSGYLFLRLYYYYFQKKPLAPNTSSSAIAHRISLSTLKESSSPMHDVRPV